MTLLSKFKSRKGIHIFEWITVFVAVAVGVTLMIKLTKGYWNARMKSQDIQVVESFYDKFPTGILTDPGTGCASCSEFVPINACGVGDCGICEKIAFRGCDIGCGKTEVCFSPGSSVASCPDCLTSPATSPCLGVLSSIECWSDQPSADLLAYLGNSSNPCTWGTMITESVDCADPTHPTTTQCIPNGACEFQCEGISAQALNFWYTPCNTLTPQNGSEDATTSTFVSSGGCTGKACEYKCPEGFKPETNGKNHTNPGNVIPSSHCECPLDGGNPNPYTVVIGADGKPTCECVQDKPECAYLPDNNSGSCSSQSESSCTLGVCIWTPPGQYGGTSGKCSNNPSNVCRTSTTPDGSGGYTCAPHCELKTPPEKKCDVPPDHDPGGGTTCKAVNSCSGSDIGSCDDGNECCQWQGTSDNIGICYQTQKTLVCSTLTTTAACAANPCCK